MTEDSNLSPNHSHDSRLSRSVRSDLSRYSLSDSFIICILRSRTHTRNHISSLKLEQSDKHSHVWFLLLREYHIGHAAGDTGRIEKSSEQFLTIFDEYTDSD